LGATQLLSGRLLGKERTPAGGPTVLGETFENVIDVTLMLSENFAATNSVRRVRKARKLLSRTGPKLNSCAAAEIHPRALKINTEKAEWRNCGPGWHSPRAS
jgi:hypothetical protein